MKPIALYCLAALAVFLIPEIPAMAGPVQTAPAAAAADAPSAQAPIDVVEIPFDKVSKLLGEANLTSNVTPLIRTARFRYDPFFVEFHFVDDVATDALYSNVEGKPLSLDEAAKLLAQPSAERTWKKIGDRSWSSDDDCTAVLTSDGKLAMTSPLFHRYLLLSGKAAAGTNIEASQGMAEMNETVRKQKEAILRGDTNSPTYTEDTINALDHAGSKLTGDGGIVIHAMIEVMRGAEPMLKRHNEAVRKATLADLYRPDKVTALKDLKSRIALCDEVKASATETVTFYEGMGKTLKAKLATTSLSPEAADTAVTQTVHGLDRRMILPRLRSELKLTALVRSEYKLLDDNPGKWSVEDGQLVIPNDALRHQFNLTMDNLEAASEELGRITQAALKNY